MEHETLARRLAATAAGLWLSAAGSALAAGTATPTDIPGVEVIGAVSAESLLGEFQTIYGTDQVNPPFELGTMGYAVRTTQPFVGVRTYVQPRDMPGKAGQVGGWVMPIAQLRGLTSAEIQANWALPIYADGTRNNMLTLVVVPAGVTFWSGVAGPITDAVDGTGDWGQGGGIQYYVGWGAAGVQSYQVPAANYVVTGAADPGPVLVYGPRLSGSARIVGGYLDGLPVAAYSDLDRALLTLDVLNLTSPTDPAPLEAAVRQLSPEIYGAVPRVVDHQSGLFLDALGRRADSKTGAWVVATGASAEFDGSAEVTGYRATSRAGMAGADFSGRDGLTLGVGGAWLTSRLDWRDAGSSTGTADTAMLGAHGSYRMGPVLLSGQIAGGMGWGEVDRRIAVADSGALPGISTAIGRTARGEPKTSAVAARLDAGVTTTLFGSARVRPFVGLQYAHVDRRGFTEHGADDLDLVVGGWNGHSLRSRLGVGASHDLGATGPLEWSVDGGLLWTRRLSASSADVSAGLVGQPGSFTVGAAPESPWGLQPSLGLTGRFGGGHLNARYEDDLRKDYRAQAIIAEVALNF
ncbi:MAG: autotransporter outer membrane beta-barrel domain-containing protein [Alphaproteobacteria bacterium]|nr:autotransporter outer membrane beta-barrel domain-containing protein [Alphaproteobacteria bacterium]